MPHCPSYLT
jgi:curved DNA-binding protein CbpA